MTSKLLKNDIYNYLQIRVQFLGKEEYSKKTSAAKMLLPYIDFFQFSNASGGMAR